MRSIPYSDIEKGVAAIAGIDPSALLAHEKILLAEYINDATKFCWDYYPWAEFTKTEERYFRDDFVPNASYEAGDEVHYEGKYYRARLANQSSTIDISEVIWYEVGDVIGVEEWSETGLYYKGAKVSYFDKSYICINQPNSIIPEHGLDPCSFDLNGISVTDTNYFEEIDSVFDRYIAYEQTGKDVIGTCLAITLEDPRYNDTSPLNWREDREGFYIEPRGESFNKVWIRYRLQAPTFTSDSTTEEVPRFLSQAIKAYAYKHWLIGDGQHEKAQLQDMYGLDLLVRELDKLDSQQDRGQQFTIIKNPYRRINAKQGFVTPVTDDKIGKLYDGTTEVSTTIEVSVQGRNVVVKGDTATEVMLTTEVTGKNALKIRESTISIEIQLGKTVGMNFAVDAYPDVIGTRVKTGVPIAGRTRVIAYNAVKYAEFKSTTGKIIISGIIVGRKQVVKTAIYKFPPPIIIIECVDVIAEKGLPVSANASISIDTVASGRSSVVYGVAGAQLKLTTTGFGRSSVVASNASVGFNLTTSVSGRNSVQKGNASGLIHLVITTSTSGIDAIHLGFCNSSISVSTDVSGQLGALESNASISFSISSENIQHKRIASRLVEIELTVHTGTAKEVQVYDSTNLTKGTSRGNGFSSSPYYDLDQDEVHLRVYGDYYIAANKVFDDSLYSIIDTNDLSNHTFFSENISSTWEDLFPYGGVDTPLENTVLINKTPVTRKFGSAYSSGSDVEVYLGMYPYHQDDYPEVLVNEYQGNGVTFKPQKTAPSGSRQDWATCMQLFTIEKFQYFDSNGVLQTGLYLQRFMDRVIGSTTYRITNTTSYFWGQKLSYTTPNGFEDFSSTAITSSSQLLNLLWHRSGYGRYYIILDDSAQSNTSNFRTVDSFGDPQYASETRCGFDAWADSNWEYGNWHDPTNTSDPWYNQQGSEQRYTPLTGTYNNNSWAKGYLFRVIPAKLKERFPLEFQDFISTSDIIGAPRFIEATKN